MEERRIQTAANYSLNMSLNTKRVREGVVSRQKVGNKTKRLNSPR